MIPVNVILQFGHDLVWDVIWQEDIKATRAHTIQAHKYDRHDADLRRTHRPRTEECYMPMRVLKARMPIVEQNDGFWSMYDYWDAHYDPSEYEGAICSLDLVSESPKPEQKFYLGKIKQGELSALDRGLDVTVRVYNQNRYGR